MQTTAYTYRCGRAAGLDGVHGRLRSSRTTTYGYDNAGRLNQITQPNGTTTQWTYDFLSRPLNPGDDHADRHGIRQPVYLRAVRSGGRCVHGSPCICRR